MPYKVNTLVMLFFPNVRLAMAGTTSDLYTRQNAGRAWVLVAIAAFLQLICGFVRRMSAMMLR
jgi:uncharacterized membrane protein